MPSEWKQLKAELPVVKLQALLGPPLVEVMQSATRMFSQWSLSGLFGVQGHHLHLIGAEG